MIHSVFDQKENDSHPSDRYVIHLPSHRSWCRRHQSRVNSVAASVIFAWSRWIFSPLFLFFFLSPLFHPPSTLPSLFSFANLRDFFLLPLLSFYLFIIIIHLFFFWLGLSLLFFTCVCVCVCVCVCGFYYHEGSDDTGDPGRYIRTRRANWTLLHRWAIHLWCTRTAAGLFNFFKCVSVFVCVCLSVCVLISFVRFSRSATWIIRIIIT